VGGRRPFCRSAEKAARRLRSSCKGHPNSLSAERRLGQGDMVHGYNGQPRDIKRDNYGKGIALSFQTGRREMPTTAWKDGRERYTGFRSGEMNDEVQDLRNAGYRPVVVGRSPSRSRICCGTSILPGRGD